MSDKKYILDELLPSLLASGNIDRHAYFKIKNSIKGLEIESFKESLFEYEKKVKQDNDEDKKSLIRTLEHVYNTINAVCGVDIKKVNRSRKYVVPRQIYMIICRDRYKASATDIMEYIGLDRSSFYKNYKSGLSSLVADDEFKVVYEKVLNQIIG